MIFIGFPTGTVKYTSFTSDKQTMSTTTVQGKNFLVNGESVDGLVGALDTYSSVKNFNLNTLTYNFNYDIENVKLYAKQAQSTGATSEITGATISADKRQIIIKTSLNEGLSNVYLLVFPNGETVVECVLSFI